MALSQTSQHRQLILFNDLFRDIWCFILPIVSFGFFNCDGEFDAAILELFADTFEQEDLFLSDNALAVIDSHAINILEALRDQAAQLTMETEQISSREIQISVRLRFPEELAKLAVSAGTRAVTANNPDSIAVSVDQVQIALSDEVAATVGAALYAAGVLDFIIVSILNLSGAKAIELGVSTISTEILQDSISEDQELLALITAVA